MSFKEIVIMIMMIVAILIELIMLLILYKKVSKFHQLSLKDTIIYPFLILVTFLILWLLISHYDHKVWYEDSFRAIKDSVDVVKLDLDKELIEKLKASKGVGYLAVVTYYGSYLISIFALFSLAFTLTRKIVVNKVSLLFKKKDELTYIFGFNEDCKNFIKGLKKENRKKIIVILDSSKLNKYVEEILYLNKCNICYKKMPYGNNLEIINTLKKLSKKENRKIHFVTFFDEETNNITFVTSAKQYLKEIDAFGGYNYKETNLIENNNIYSLDFSDISLKNLEILGAELLFINKNICWIKTNNQNVEIKINENINNDNIIDNIYLINPDKFNIKNDKIIPLNLNISIPNYDYKNKLKINLVEYKKPRDIYIKLFCSNIQKPILDEIIIQNNNLEKVIDSKGRLKDLFDFSRGMIKAINKYDVIAHDFIIKNSFARFIDDDNIDLDSTLKNCDINLYVLGFGKVNKALTRDILINNQFVEKIPGDSKDKYKLNSKRMYVRIYEKKKEIDDDFSFDFIKYNKNNYGDDHFCLPENFINKNDIKLDNRFDDLFLNDIYDDIKNRTINNRKQYNFFIISIDDDSKNWNIATKIKKALEGINNTKNIFFVRTKSKESLNTDVKLFKNMYSFGNEIIDGTNIKDSDSSSVFSYENVVQNEIMNVALKNHIMYEAKKYNLEVDDNNLRLAFLTLSQLKQLSNIYSVFGLYSKLALIRINKDNLFKNKIIKDYMDNLYDPAELIKEKESFALEEIMAFIEKERWNAFQIGYGVLPMKKSIRLSLSYDEVDRLKEVYHANISNNYGIYDYYKLLNDDTIKYDYAPLEYFKSNPDALDSFYKFATKIE